MTQSRRRLSQAALLIVLAVGLVAAGCGQKEADVAKNESAGKEVVELAAWPEREAYDETFNDSRNATLALWAQACSCGAEGLSCRQSYTDASRGASAVRECPQSAVTNKDNLVTEEYADSFYCSACGKQELAFAEKDIWLYRSNLNLPHYHQAEADSPAQYWCKIFVDPAQKRWVYIYEGADGTGEPLEKRQLQREEDAVEMLGHLLLENIQSKAAEA